jgi:Ala-tRNA(Pro) deacylase
MNATQQSVINLLTELQIEHSHFTHPPVFSTTDVVALTEKIPGSDTKNLFLRDEKRTRYILVCVRAETRVNLKELGKLLGMKGLSFGSPEDMLEFLGITPGSVCLFSLMNDRENRVTGFIDATLAPEEEMQNHPLENTATIVIKAGDLERFCAHVNHPLQRIEIPARAA